MESTLNSNIDYQCLDIEEPICRVCFDPSHNNDNLITPCKCSGGSRYIHVSCLKTWRFSNNTQSEARSNCMECKYSYKTRIIKKQMPFFYKLSINFHKNFCFSYIILFILLNLIGRLIR